jgi:hypothetical protein
MTAALPDYTQETRESGRQRHLLLLLATAGLGRLRGRRRGLVLLRGLQRDTRAD